MNKVKDGWNGPGKQDGVLTEFKPEYDGLHIDLEKKGNAEWWYFDAHLENGYFVVGFFRARHERTGKTGVEITIYTPEGKKIQNQYNYLREDLVATKEKANVKIGNNYIKVDYTNKKCPIYEIYLDEGKYGLHLIYKSTVQGWMPGKGYTEFGNKGHFGWCVAIPKATVEGTIKVDNQEISVKGIGYHDHNWLNFNLALFVEYWYWGRIYSDNFTILFAYIKCNKRMDNYPIHVLMVAKGEKVILSTGEFKLVAQDFKFNDKANNEYPKKLILNISEQRKITLEVEKIVDAGNLLFELSPVLRFIVKNLLRLRPSYFRLGSKFAIDFEVDGVSFKETGSCLHEIVRAK